MSILDLPLDFISVQAQVYVIDHIFFDNLLPSIETTLRLKSPLDEVFVAGDRETDRSST